MKFELINKLTKEVVTVRDMNGVQKLSTAEIIFGLLKKLDKKQFREIYEVKEAKV